MNSWWRPVGLRSTVSSSDEADEEAEELDGPSSTATTIARLAVDTGEATAGGCSFLTRKPLLRGGDPRNSRSDDRVALDAVGRSNTRFDETPQRAARRLEEEGEEDDDAYDGAGEGEKRIDGEGRAIG